MLEAANRKASRSQNQSARVQPTLQIEDDEGWTKISLLSREVSGLSFSEEPESMQDRVVRVSEDIREIEKFYNIAGSPARHERLSEFFDAKLAALSSVPFASYSQDEKVDYLLLKSFLSRAQRNLELDRVREAEFAPFVEPFASPIRKWCEIRQRQLPEEVFDPQVLADDLSTTREAVLRSIAPRRGARRRVLASYGKQGRTPDQRATRSSK